MVGIFSFYLLLCKFTLVLYDIKINDESSFDLSLNCDLLCNKNSFIFIFIQAKLYKIKHFNLPQYNTAFNL